MGGARWEQSRAKAGRPARVRALASCPPRSPFPAGYLVDVHNVQRDKDEHAQRPQQEDDVVDSCHHLHLERRQAAHHELRNAPTCVMW